jgi:hypothetical protein
LLIGDLIIIIPAEDDDGSETTAVIEYITARRPISFVQFGIR